MGWVRTTVAIAVGLAAACTAGCRGGFDDHVPGLAEGVIGVRLSSAGALVIEDGRYDAATAIDGRGYAVAWVEFPAGDRTPQVAFAVVGEDGERIVAPRTIEVLAGLPTFVRMISGPAGYLLVGNRGPDVVLSVPDADGIVRHRREDSGPAYDDITGIGEPNGFLITYTANALIQTAQLDADGVPITGPTVIDMTTFAQR